MEMGGHDDKGVGAEVLVGVAMVQAVCDDFAGGFGDEDGEPFDDGEGEEVKADPFLNAVVFHEIESAVCETNGRGNRQT